MPKPGRKELLSDLFRTMRYGGVGKKDYYAIRDEMWEANRKSLRNYSAMVVGGMGLLYLLSFFIETLVSSRLSYVTCVVFGALMFGLSVGPIRGKVRLIRLCETVFTTLLLMFGAYLGTVVEPNQASTSFGILMFVSPLLFTDSPLWTDLQIVLAIAVYTAAARLTQTWSMFVFNMSFVLPYGGASLILCAIFMRDKIRKHALAHTNRYLLERDQLTGLYNRRCYDEKMQTLTSKGCKPGTVFCAFDVNGLKTVNDTMGHGAGDELLQGAADCIRQVFAPYGPCYRTGGDEFFVIVEETMNPGMEALLKDLEKRCGEFRGETVQGISVSAGTAEAGSGDSAVHLAQAADQKMYEAKEEYYRQNPQLRKR